MGTSLPPKATPQVWETLTAASCPLHALALRTLGRPDTKTRSVTDLRGKTGRFQGYDNGKFFRKQVASDENPGRREADGVGGSGRELEPQCTLNPRHADSARSAIGRDRLCQDVQGAQVCQGNHRRVTPGRDGGRDRAPRAQTERSLGGPQERPL